MENYLHLFETTQEFEAQYNGSGYTEPWVSYTMETSAVTFNKGGGGHDYSQDYLTFKVVSGGNITWSCYDDMMSEYTDADKVIKKSKNGNAWTNMPRTLSVSAGDVVLFKGDNSCYAVDNYYYDTFSENTTADFNIEGNIMSLVNSTGYTSLDSIGSQNRYAFYGFFMNCNIHDAGNLVLPATALSENCYESMFRGCTSLTQAPELPATTLTEDCYKSMFKGCTSLTQAPELPAISLENGCYSSMFEGCTSLTQAPSILPATELYANCYAFMFQNCTSLTQSPILVDANNDMADYGYNQMFKNCTNLSQITCLLTELYGMDLTFDWVDGVSETGTFIKSPLMNDWFVGTTDGIPEGWTIVNAS